MGFSLLARRFLLALLRDRATGLEPLLGLFAVLPSEPERSVLPLLASPPKGVRGGGGLGYPAFDRPFSHLRSFGGRQRQPTSFELRRTNLWLDGPAQSGQSFRDERILAA